jgi:hypothetical protein
MGVNFVFRDAETTFPLSVSSNGRYLQQADGTPFFMNGDTPWQLVGNCTNAQITTYLEDRAAKKFNAIMIEAPTAYFATQSPLYNNVDGIAPFTSTSYTAASFESLNNTYWSRVDHAINEAKRLGIVVVFLPAYLGSGGGGGGSGDQGWDYQVDAASDANLQTYGATLATRYTQGNIIWCMGGDYNAPNIAKGWNIATGIRSVTPNALISYHGGRGSSGYSQASGQTGFNLNNTYTDGLEYTYCATEYARTPAMPFFHIEGWYEGDGGLTDAGYRRQAYATMLSGGLAGHLLGVAELWGLGGYGASTTAAEALANHLNTTVANDMTHFYDLFQSVQWWKYEPKTDTSLVSSSLSSGASRIIAARASDGNSAMVYTPSGSTVTVVMSAMTPGSVRARLFDPTVGTFSTVSGSPFANTGTQNIATGGERVLVLDAA